MGHPKAMDNEKRVCWLGVGGGGVLENGVEQGCKRKERHSWSKSCQKLLHQARPGSKCV